MVHFRLNYRLWTNRRCSAIDPFRWQLRPTTHLRALRMLRWPERESTARTRCTRSKIYRDVKKMHNYIYIYTYINIFFLNIIYNIYIYYMTMTFTCIIYILNRCPVFKEFWCENQLCFSPFESHFRGSAIPKIMLWQIQRKGQLPNSLWCRVLSLSLSPHRLQTKFVYHSSHFFSPCCLGQFHRWQKTTPATLPSRTSLC